MSIMEVCRLCENNTDLVDIFKDDPCTKFDRSKIIYVTTGVRIEPTDIVSQKVCSRCCKITLKMYQFRQDALKQDKALKDKCDQLLTRGMKLPNTNIIIRKDSSNVAASKPAIKSEPRPEIVQSEIKRKPPNMPATDVIHPSITDVFRKYPQLKLPKKCFGRNMSPTVSLNMGEVERYFKKRKLDIKKYIYVPKLGKTFAKKSTTTLQSAKPTRAWDSLGKAGKKNPESRDRSHAKKPRFTKIMEQRRSSSVDASDSSSILIGPLRTRKVKIRRKRIRSSSSDDSLQSEMSTVPESNSVSENKSDEDKNAEVAPSMSDETPETLSLKSRALFVCNLCSSVQYSASELKWHSMKHMVCQFCKSKFKSIEAKEAHIKHDCEMKKMMNSGPVVKLEKVDLVLEVRQKYQNSFVGFKLIPGLDIRPVEEVILPESNMISASEEGDVIVLSDDDESQPAMEQINRDPLSGIATEESRNVAPVYDNNLTYSTVSVVKPDVRIKNNSVLNKMDHGLSDVQFIKELLSAVAPEKQFADKVAETDLPSSKDIAIKANECFGELKSLKEHLRVFKVPITMKNGPFNVAYRYKRQHKPPRNLQVWTNLLLTQEEDGAESVNGINVNNHMNGIVQPPVANIATPPPPPYTHVLHDVRSLSSNSTPCDSFFLNNSVSSTLPSPGSRSHGTIASSAAVTSVYAPTQYSVPQNSGFPLTMRVQSTYLPQPSDVLPNSPSSMLRASLQPQSQPLVPRSTVIQPSAVPYELPLPQRPATMGVRVKSMWELR
ncbi:uncharacterized protein LOC132701967 isoform X2 [Cylas formicarius]|uniref:uncharacterized protein LOC132701967 isoform X2 n=1 Tax=Cylas formicarius TaxID=197179 RepID=UPI00295842DC|nr:uncharacterized protein LOC132701967 isoform X2 [Cylas formicarius]